LTTVKLTFTSANAKYGGLNNLSLSRQCGQELTPTGVLLAETESEPATGYTFPSGEDPNAPAAVATTIVDSDRASEYLGRATIRPVGLEDLMILKGAQPLEAGDEEDAGESEGKGERRAS